MCSGGCADSSGFSLPVMSLMLCDGKICYAASEVSRVVVLPSGSDGVNVIAVTETNITNYTAKALTWRIVLLIFKHQFERTCTLTALLHIMLYVINSLKISKIFMKIILYECTYLFFHLIRFDYTRTLFTLNSRVYRILLYSCYIKFIKENYINFNGFFLHLYLLFKFQCSKQHILRVHTVQCSRNILDL